MESETNLVLPRSAQLLALDSQHRESVVQHLLEVPFEFEHPVEVRTDVPCLRMIRADPSSLDFQGFPKRRFGTREITHVHQDCAEFVESIHDGRMEVTVHFACKSDRFT
ncbi:MAG: hypothetical protein U1F23_05710 [Lysobacterales bacterium]